MNYSHHKLTRSGPYVDFDSVEKPFFYGTNYHVKHTPTGRSISTPEENQLKSTNRAKKKVRHLVNSNAFQWFKSNGSPFLPIFITLTFELDIRNVDEANDLYTEFMQRLNYFLSKRKNHYLQYLSVIEFQDKTRGGVVHYHTLFFNMRYVKQIYDEIRRVWTHGNVNIKSIRNIKDIARYMVKYMTKNMADGRLAGKKKYFTSRGLLKPKEIYDEKTVLEIVKQLPETCKLPTNSWSTEHNGIFTRTTYDLRNSPGALALLDSLGLK